VTLEKAGGGQVSLRLYATAAFLPLARSYVEKAATALGMGKQGAHDLALAAKEVFGHLCRVVLKKKEAVEIHCTSGGYYVLAELTFVASDIDLRAFNLTATTSLTDDQGQEEAGLVMASRLVDRLTIARLGGGGMKLKLLKEKSYPPFEESPVNLPQPLGEFFVRSPNPAELKLFARLVKRCYQHQVLPEVFNYPGKLVDMLAGGRYGAAVAVGPAGELGGGTFWHRSDGKEVEFFGPYVFNQKADSPIAGALIESCIGAVARTNATIISNRFATPEFPREQFELLGMVLLCSDTTACMPREAWFRLMQEDMGTIAWVSPGLEDFLQQQYERLVLPREIRVAAYEGEQHPRHSVISTHVYRSDASAILRPMWFGTDFFDNLAQHLKLLRQEGILNIFFFLDVGESWQAFFTPGLLQNDFKPCLILPYTGVGDVVVFQFQGTV
jgi:hypothetical protein